VADGDAAVRLRTAQARLDRLGWYPRPVDMHRVRLISAPLAFRLPRLRRFDGFATWRLILVRRPLAQVSDDLITHELCHVWQLQHAPLRMPLSYLTRPYSQNPFERQARAAAALTRGPAAPAATSVA
jgi:hypothetical protein